MLPLAFVACASAAGLGTEFFARIFGAQSLDLDLDREVAPLPRYTPAAHQDGQAPFLIQQQPGAHSPVHHQSIRELQWGDLNILHTTDTHGWLSGHLLEAQFGADWGDFYSFAHRMAEHAAELKSDLILVDSGDRDDGNGLGDATRNKGEYLRELFKKLPYDLITVGNHELYNGKITVHEYNEMFAHFKDAYVASNVYVKRSKVHQHDFVEESHHKWIPMGNKYRVWDTQQGKKLLGLGFVFDFGLNDDHYSKVVHVEKEIKEEWFQELLVKTKDLDAIVIAGHIPLRNSPEFDAIVREIRKHDKHIPVLIFGGHSHIRDAKIYDEHAWALQSGRYLETVGFASLSDGHGPHDPHHPHRPHDPHDPHDPHKPHPPHGPHDPHKPHPPNGSHPHPPNGSHPHPPNGSHPHPNATLTALDTLNYSRSYIDFNRVSFKHHAHAEDFDTKVGNEISREIAHYRAKLKLDEKLACVPKTYFTDRAAFPAEDSVFSLLQDKILPKIEVSHRNGHAAYVLLNTGAIRYDLVKGAYTHDTNYIVTPFSKKWMVIEEIPREVADELLAILNGYDQVGRPAIGDVEQSHNTTLIPGYVTQDDFGDHGDDTKHKAWVHHPIPNVIHAERHVRGDDDDVDLVFEEFLTHFVVKALVEMRKYRLIRPRFYLYTPLGDLLADYFKQLDAC